MPSTIPIGGNVFGGVAAFADQLLGNRVGSDGTKMFLVRGRGREFSFWHDSGLPITRNCVCLSGQSGKHMPAARFSQFDSFRTSVTSTENARLSRPADAVQVAAVIRYGKGRMVQAMITPRRIVLLSLAVCWTVSVSSGQAQETEKAFYAGKTVRMIVGSGPAGGYDIFSRLIAPYLAKTLGTTVIVENQPGAGGLIALNRLYVAPPDGLQISLANGTSAAFAQLTGDQAARFDLAKFTYLSTVGARGPQARLPCRAGIQGQRRRRACGHAR
jgi:hypothetical protein